ncbi:MAG: DRTGG domain-containing protein [Armatimonadota bacterium]
MKLAEVAEALEAEVVVGRDRLEAEIPVGGASDMVSDLVFFGRPGMVLLTGLTKSSVVRAAQVADVSAIVFVRGKRPESDAVELATEIGLPLLVTAHSMYDSCGRLYVRGLPGVIPASRRADSGDSV